MFKNNPILFLCSLLILGGCIDSGKNNQIEITDTIVKNIPVLNNDTIAVDKTVDAKVSPPSQAKIVPPDSLINFAKTLIGIPYRYASIDPAVGFDCSGFITYVHNHFNITVPRSSVDFTNVGTTIPVASAKPGDLILFTGTDSLIRVVGHMGIVTENTDTLKFIHSSSGKANGVVITPLNNYYQGRFVKVIRL